MKEISHKNNDQNKTSFRFDPNPLSVLALLVGLGAIIAGLYFRYKHLTSDGHWMSKYHGGSQAGIDGNGMIFCGAIILLIDGTMSVSKKVKK